MNHTEDKTDLSHLYSQLGNESGLGSLSRLQHHTKRSNKEVKEWLLNQPSYSLHFPARRRFRRNRIIATSIGDLCQADLVDMTSFAAGNDGFKYFLTFIDVFSKKAFVVPLKSKNAVEIKNGFKQIFDQFVPKQIQTDRGTEFKNATILNFMRKHGVHLFFSYNQDIKASVVERFNRTLRARMFRYFTSVGHRRYVNVLQQLVQSYNYSHHRAIRMRPVDVEKADQNQVFRNLYGYKNERELLQAEPAESQKFQTGDTVRLRYHLEGMDKGYYPNFSDQTYQVVRVIPMSPRIMYKVVDFAGKMYPRKLYAEDMLRIPANPGYRIERVIKTRTGRSGREVLVKWLNYPDSANSWIPESNIKSMS